MENVKRLIDDLIGAGKKEKCREQILAETEPLFIILTHFARVEKELRDLRERNKDVEDLRAKIKDLQKQHLTEMRNSHETINGLIHVVSSIMAENINLKQQIQSFFACHYQELAPTCSENWDEDCSGQGADQGRLDEADEVSARTSENAEAVRSPGAVEHSETGLPRLKEFEPLQLLGRGGYGRVYLVRKIGGVDDGNLYALNTLDIKEITSYEAGRQQYRTERGLLEKGLEAPFMVGLYYAFQTQSKLCLVLDYYAGGNLLHLLREWGGVFSVDETRLYLAEIIEAVEYLHKSWGRIGTTIGGMKLAEVTSLKQALKIFECIYKERTGNEWASRNHFKKVADSFYPVYLDYSQLDLQKMPMGKLSKKQIQQAYSVLIDLQELIKNGGSDSRFIDASNRFYTLIPHDFGVENPPVLKSEEMFKQKIEMLDSLMEIEIAYNLLKTKSDADGDVHPLDAHYAKLNTHIEVLDKNTDEFELLKQYVKNTHATTHTHYDLEILEVFKLKRSGDEKRYKPFKKLHNRKLLWHGSRLTNFAGILSQGLRIAPPEAPVTGYMFGKGIYFADMVSKSANYCCTSPNNSVGLLLLCEVALGNMYERKGADYINKLPKDKHSTKGLGMTEPDPKASVLRDDGVEVPAGKGISVRRNDVSLLYNEYIVYDVSQVNIQYLLKMKFNYKY